jgi:hypothetical protein
MVLSDNRMYGVKKDTNFYTKTPCVCREKSVHEKCQSNNYIVAIACAGNLCGKQYVYSCAVGVAVEGNGSLQASHHFFGNVEAEAGAFGKM